MCWCFIHYYLVTLIYQPKEICCLNLWCDSVMCRKSCPKLMILIAMLTAIFCWLAQCLTPQHNVPHNFIILQTFQLLSVMSVSSFLRRLKAHLQLGGKLADARLKHDLANFARND